MSERSDCRSPSAYIAVGAAYLLTQSFLCLCPLTADGMDGWRQDPLAWVEKDGALVAVGTGFAISEVGPGSSLAVAGVVSPESCENPGWASIGLGVWSSESDFWKLSIFKAPTSAKTPHGFEFGEMRAGKWMSQGRHKCVERKVSGQWEFGKSYAMGVELSPTGIVGVVRDIAGGSEIFRCRYEFSDSRESSLPWYGAIHAAQGLRGSVRSCAARLKSAYDGEARRFPEYRSDRGPATAKGRATGFFHMEKIDGRWWAVDPLGNGLVLAGVDHVTWTGMMCEALGYSPYRRNNESRYESIEKWADETVGRLRKWGFTMLGAGCDTAHLGRRGLAHTAFLSMGERLCREDSEMCIAQSQHAPGTSFPNVFHPEFPALCDYWALERCGPNKDDPWLLGYFIDNELAWSGRPGSMTSYGMLQKVRSMPEGHSARKALDAFIARNVKGGWRAYDELCRAEKDRVNRAFLKLVAERYFAITTRAIRRHDPNHMVLGCRFAGLDGMENVVWDAAAKYCDIVTFNFYPWIDIDSGVAYTKNGGDTLVKYFREYAARANRPLMVTEWSFPALDTGRACRFGAGQRFRTQSERVKASEICAKTLLTMPYIAGYSYFMWVDEPELGMSKAFPEDCNYGLVDENGKPYEALTAMFARVHRNPEKWRNKPLDVRSRRAKAPPSDRERFIASVSKFDKANGVRFSKSESGWRIENDAGLVLEGRLKGRPVESVSVGGRSYGVLSAMLETLDCGSFAWYESGYTKDVSFAREGGCGVVTLTSENPGPHNVELVLRVTVAPNRKDFHFDIPRLRNIGKEPFFVNRLYIMPRAGFDKPVAEGQVISVWKCPKTLYWRGVDGCRFGVETTDASAEQFQFWISPTGGQHPDARFRPTPTREPVEVPSGAVYVPAYPVGAHIVARPD